MYLLMTDETNVQPTAQCRFFAYGGLIVPFERLCRLSARIEAIRIDCGYRRRDSLKFDTHACPRNVTREAARDAKRRVILACIANDCLFIAYVVLHAIARNRPQRTLVEWAASHVIGKFNYFLTLQDSHGIVQVDRLEVKHAPRRNRAGISRSAGVGYLFRAIDSSGRSRRDGVAEPRVFVSLFWLQMLNKHVSSGEREEP